MTLAGRGALGSRSSATSTASSPTTRSGLARPLGQPEDAARLVGWLCTEDAAWITGQVIDSEGGFVRHRVYSE